MVRADLLYCISDEQVRFNSLLFRLFAGGDSEFEKAKKTHNDTLVRLYHIKRDAAKRAQEKGEIKKDADLDKLVSIIFSSYNMFSPDMSAALDGFEKVGGRYGGEILLDFVIVSLKREFFN